MSATPQTEPLERACADGKGRAVRLGAELLRWAGDRVNPILVKETRQALKSRFFGAMFTILLALSWGATIMALALIGPDARFGNHGPAMFLVYQVLLGFWLLVVVPFSAYRSLAVEQEDRTYELVSITTLNPRQIVRGKLGSTIVQMVVYLSALAPCLAFTYLLRGIDLLTICFVLGHVVLASVGLATMGLFWSTLTTSRHWQVIFTVLLIAGLLFNYFLCMRLLLSLVDEFRGAAPFDQPEFWAFDAAIVSLLAGYALLAYYAAAAQISFPSDNRSTRLRVVMLAEQLLFLFWMAWGCIHFGPQEKEAAIFFPLSFLTFSAVHWYAMGVLMTGESPALSRRARRSLPQSFLGRMLLSWFNPGPGTGLMFATSSLAAVTVVALVALSVAERFWPAVAQGLPRQSDTLCFGVLATCYVIIYLGLGGLLVRLGYRLGSRGLVLTFLAHFLVVLVCCFVPMSVQLMHPTLRNEGYTFLQVTNPLWTLLYLVDQSSPPELPTLLVVVPLLALLVFAGNLPFVAREVCQLRLPEPERVREEEVALAALRRPPQPVRISPWDELPPAPPGERPVARDRLAET